MENFVFVAIILGVCIIAHGAYTATLEPKS